ncbi:DUF1801 domain-containing protein [Ferruginibacter sp. SUN002]|uniref:DUF1801 domain-containing protein n=1 Tax=Ferruginibacter sp. SUN002 TaxID=2937789 RepID=UPI003D36F451
MQSKAATVDAYIKELPPERQVAIKKLRALIKKNIPKGFKEEMGYGMMGYVVPHSIYPEGYHCTPELPLPFLGVASQKNFIAVYHMGIYADKKLLDWFTKEFAKTGLGKLDMGKSCMRFKNLDKIPYELIGELVSKITVADWIKLYEEKFKKR